MPHHPIFTEGDVSALSAHVQETIRTWQYPGDSQSSQGLDGSLPANVAAFLHISLDTTKADAFISDTANLSSIPDRWRNSTVPVLVAYTDKTDCAPTEAECLCTYALFHCNDQAGKMLVDLDSRQAWAETEKVHHNRIDEASWRRYLIEWAAAADRLSY